MIVESWPTLATTGTGADPYEGDHTWRAYGDSDPTRHGVRVEEEGTLALPFNALILPDDDIGRYVSIRIERYTGGSSSTRSGLVACFSGTNPEDATYYAFDQRHSDGSTRLMKVTEGVNVNLDTPYDAGTEYPKELELVVRPGDGGAAIIEGWIDGVLRMSAVDPTPFTGTKVGMKGSLGGGSTTYWGTFFATPWDEPLPPVVVEPSSLILPSSVTPPDILRLIYAFPSQDILTTNWTNESGGSNNLYTRVSGLPPSDDTYVQTSTHGAPIVFKLQGVQTPTSRDNHRVVFRARRDGPGVVQATISLHEGYVNESNQGTVIASYLNPVDISNTFTDYVLNIGPLAAETISDYQNLFVRIIPYEML